MTTKLTYLSLETELMTRRRCVPVFSLVSTLTFDNTRNCVSKTTQTTSGSPARQDSDRVSMVRRVTDENHGKHEWLIIKRHCELQ